MASRKPNATANTPVKANCRTVRGTPPRRQENHASGGIRRTRFTHQGCATSITTDYPRHDLPVAEQSSSRKIVAVLLCDRTCIANNSSVDGRMLLAEGAPDLMKRLSRLPTPPHVALLPGRKSKPFPLGHKHPL